MHASPEFQLKILPRSGVFHLGREATMEQEQFVDRGRLIGFFRQLEERLLHPEVRSSGDQLSRLLADDFIEFGSSGAIYNKQQIIDSLAREQIMERSIADFSVRALADDVVLLTYRSTRRNPATAEQWYSFRSSFWKLNDARWQMIFHQGTPTG
jgi:hypothetical protein